MPKHHVAVVTFLALELIAVARFPQLEVYRAVFACFTDVLYPPEQSLFQLLSSLHLQIARLRVLVQ